MNDVYERELRIGEILSATAGIFFKNLKFIVPLCLLALLPRYIIDAFIPENDLIMQFVQNPSEFSVDFIFGNWIAYSFISQVVSACFTCLLAGGLTNVAATALSGGKVTAAGIMDFSVMKWPKLIVTAILAILIMNVSAILIVPIIYFAIAFAFYTNIAASTGEWGLKALKRSRLLVKGHFGKTFLYMIAFGILSTITAYVLGFVVSGIYPETLETVDGKILYAAVNTIIDVFCSFFVLAQAVWFVNIMAVRNGRQAQ